MRVLVCACVSVYMRPCVYGVHVCVCVIVRTRVCVVFIHLNAPISACMPVLSRTREKRLTPLVSYIIVVSIDVCQRLRGDTQLQAGRQV